MPTVRDTVINVGPVLTYTKIQPSYGSGRRGPDTVDVDDEH